MQTNQLGIIMIRAYTMERRDGDGRYLESRIDMIQ